MRVIIALLLIAALTGACSSSKKTFSEDLWHAEVSSADVAKLYAPHFADGEFFNPWMPMKNKGALSVFEWKFSKKSNTYTPGEKSFMPTVIPEPGKRIRTLGASDFVLWVGHNTFLLRIGGNYWITDPIFSERALLPKRRTPPGISIGEIESLAPKINVLITHNHYDHLDEASIRKLPKKAKFFIPLGLKRFFLEMGRTDVTELDWWEESMLGGGSRLICLPAQHWSKRISQPFNTTLWASYMLITPNLKVYFGGDSGYFIGYREFGKKFPGIDYALIPTTAYHPRWFMHYAHLDINESIMAFRDLGARHFIPTQWGTFQLGDEPPGYPAIDLKRKIAACGLDPKRFLIMDIGGIEVLHKNVVQ